MHYFFCFSPQQSLQILFLFLVQFKFMYTVWATPHLVLACLLSLCSSVNPSHRVPSSVTEVTFSHHCLYPVGPSSHYLHTSFLCICFSYPIPPSIVISEVFGAQCPTQPPHPSLSEEQEAAVSDPPGSITYSRLVCCSCIP